MVAPHWINVFKVQNDSSGNADRYGDAVMLMTGNF